MDSGNVEKIASNNDINALKTGWKQGFGDNDEFIDYFFMHYDNDNTRFFHRNEKGRIVAQLHAFVFEDNNCNQNGCYIYGVTTLPEYRGQGIAAAMIKTVLHSLKTQGVAYVVLIAENPQLQAWYETLGFIKMPHTIEVRGINDNMNFAMEDKSLNKGLYYLLNSNTTQFTTKINIPQNK